MAGRFSVETVFSAVDKITAPVRRMETSIGRFSRNTQKRLASVNASASKLTTTLRNTGIAAVASLALVSTSMADVVSTGATFEQTLVNAAAKFPGEIRKGTEEFERLSAAAQHVGKTTEFSASQSAEALNFLAMAGFSAENSIAALPGVVDLATAAQIDLATATDIASDALGAFDLVSDKPEVLAANLARVNDVLAKTATSSNTTVEMIFESMKKAAPIATQAGASIETVSAMLGTMANAGIKAEKAGTATANSFLNLTSPTTKVAKLLKQLGVEVTDTNGKMHDMPDIIDSINRATAGMTETQKLATQATIFGREGLAGVSVLLQRGGDDLRKYRASLEGATGASSKMAGVMRDTLQGRLNSLKSTIEGVKISIFGMTEGPLSDAIDKTTEWIRANEKLIATNVGEFLAGIINNFGEIVTAGRKIAGVIALYLSLVAALKVAALTLTLVTFAVTAGKVAITSLVVALKLLAGALIFARNAMLLLNLVFMANPIGVVVAGIMLLVGAAALVYAAWDPVKQFFADLWEGITSAIEGVMSKVRKVKEFFGWQADQEAAVKVTQKVEGDLPDMSTVAPGFEEAIGFEQREAISPIVDSPQERTAHMIEEKRSTERSELVIKDETGRAEMNRKTGGGSMIMLEQSGAFE